LPLYLKSCVNFPFLYPEKERGRPKKVPVMRSAGDARGRMALFPDFPARFFEKAQNFVF